MFEHYRAGAQRSIRIARFAPLGLIAEHAVAYSTLFFLTFYVGSAIIGTVAWKLGPLRVLG